MLSREARVLVIWPPGVPGYFNAGHRLALFQVAQHLRETRPGLVVEAWDAGALNVTWKEVADRLFQRQYDAIIAMNDFDAFDGIGRLTEYAKAFKSSTRLATFGRLSNRIPGFFRQFGLDAIFETGDYEAVAEDWIQFLQGDVNVVGGAWIAESGTFSAPTKPGRIMAGEHWALADVSEIPYAAYDALYRDDRNKFCGIPERRELVVQVARGCPMNCSFCEVPRLQGTRERRLPVDRTLDYIADCFMREAFEYVAFYAPTFTLNSRWVREFCRQKGVRGMTFAWKCTTTTAHLDEDLVRSMADAGCVRISVGLETLESGGLGALPPAKRFEEERFRRLAKWCHQAGVELNCFVILGLPGTTPSGCEHTVSVVQDCGARVRPTMYSPIEELRDDMSQSEVASFNRHFAHSLDSPGDVNRLYKLLFGNVDWITNVGERIPKSAHRLSKRVA